jgi:hypothetical protein
MRIRALLLVSLTVIVTLPGCGTSADRLVERQIMLLEEMADAYEKGAPQETIDEIKKTMAENDKKLDELKMTEDAKRKLILKHKADLDRAEERVRAAMKLSEQAGADQRKTGEVILPGKK